MADEIPKVEIYVSDKWILLAHAVGGGVLVLSVAAEPVTPWMWVLLVSAVIGGAVNPLLSRLRPTPRQAGAMRIAAAAIRQDAVDVEEILAESDARRAGSVTP